MIRRSLTWNCTYIEAIHGRGDDEGWTTIKCEAGDEQKKCIEKARFWLFLWNLEIIIESKTRSTFNNFTRLKKRNLDATTIFNPCLSVNQTTDPKRKNVKKIPQVLHCLLLLHRPNEARKKLQKLLKAMQKLFFVFLFSHLFFFILCLHKINSNLQSISKS